MHAMYLINFVYRSFILSCLLKAAISSQHHSEVLVNRLLFMIKRFYYCCSQHVDNYKLYKEQYKKNQTYAHLMQHEEGTEKFISKLK